MSCERRDCGDDEGPAKSGSKTCCVSCKSSSGRSSQGSCSTFAGFRNISQSRKVSPPALYNPASHVFRHCRLLTVLSVVPHRTRSYEAHKIKLGDALEAWELEKWKNQKQQEMFQREAKFKHQK